MRRETACTIATVPSKGQAELAGWNGRGEAGTPKKYTGDEIVIYSLILTDRYIYHVGGQEGRQAQRGWWAGAEWSGGIQTMKS